MERLHVYINFLDAAHARTKDNQNIDNLKIKLLQHLGDTTS